MVNPATCLDTSTPALNLPTARACFRCRCNLVCGVYSVAEPHTSSTTIAAHGAPRVMRHRFRWLVCGCCGSDIVVESDTRTRQVRCPHYSHRVKVVRYVSHTCEHCVTLSRVDLASGSVVATCHGCGNSFTVGPTVAPALRRHRGGQRRSRPRRGTNRTWAGAFTLLVGGVVVLYILGRVSLGWLGSDG